MFSLRRKPAADGLPTARILPFRNRKSAVAVDLEGDLLRVAQASGRGASTRITRVASARLEIAADKRDDASALGLAIKAALVSLKISSRELVLALPRAQVVLRPLQVPMVADVRELASLINFQISKDLPFRLEDAVIDFKVLRVVEVPASGENQEIEKRLEVLVGAVRADVVEFYRETAKAAGGKLLALGLRSVAAAFCAAKCTVSDIDGALLLLLVRPDETTIEVIHERKLVFSRAAAITASPSDPVAFLQSLEIEVVRSLHSYEGSGVQQPLRKMLVGGGTGVETQLRDLLGQRLNVPAEILNPASCPEIERVEPTEAAAAVAPIGLALSALENGGLTIDFANPKKPAVQGNARRTQLLLAAVAGVAILITLIGIRTNLVKKRTKIKQEAQAQLIDAEKKLPIYRRLKGQTKVVNGWIAEDQNWLDHLAYLTAVLPAADQIFVTTFTVSPQHLIRFSVQARTGELLAELDKSLRAAGYEVRPLSITPASDKNGYNFRTTVELSIPKKLKPDLAKAKPPARPADDVSLKGVRKG